MDWLTRDGTLLLTAKSLRTLGYGLLTVLFGLYLDELGFAPTTVGLLLSATYLGAAGLTALFAARADRWGRRRMLTLSTSVMIVTALLFAWQSNLWLLLVAALSGTLIPYSGETAPSETLEATILPQTVPIERRNQAFATYYAVGAAAVALGSLAAGLTDVLQNAFQLDALSSYRWLITGYAGLGALSLVAILGLSPRIELAGPAPIGRGQISLGRSRRAVYRLASLFALDSFAGGFVVHGLIAYWLSIRFGVGPAVLAPLFFTLNVLNGITFFLSARFANRFGLLNTMVFTHLPSNLFLILIPFMPTLALAIACLVALHTLANMDVPTRASYVVAVVDPEERTAATALTMLVRPLSQSVSPVFAGFALQLSSFAAPFVLGGSLKIVYDVILFRNFRKLEPPDEVLRKAQTGDRMAGP